MKAEEKFNPEIFIALAAPIGTDLDCVEEELSSNLRSFGYKTVQIRVSEIISRIVGMKFLKEHFAEVVKPPKTLREKIEAGNKIRSVFKDPDILSCLVCLRILSERMRIKTHEMSTEEVSALSPEERATLETVPIASTAYIIRQLKRPEEVRLLREIYGPHFILISANGDIDKRLSRLENHIGKTEIHRTPKQRAQEARDLMDEDSEQEDKDFGQLISETFHLADFFVETNTRESVEKSARRFVRGFFGSNRISPTKDEYGTYFAKAASLKTVDMSRQVGAAIFTEDGDIITTGCNDVAKAGGGQFWEDDAEKYRDIDLGSEANKEETNRIVFDFLKTLHQKGVLKEGQNAETLLSDHSTKDAIMESMVGEITEYGRMIHAEMAAITDAARLGRGVNNASLYVTTYPCHNCAKHIISSGIKKVVYVEPYPKSRATTLYGHAISEVQKSDSVIFQHFYGIAPRLYSRIFEKTKKRRDKSGNVVEWIEGSPYPLIRHQDYDIAELRARERFVSRVDQLIKP